MSIFRMSAKEAVYFDLFIEFADKTHEAAKIFENMVYEYCDIHEKIMAIEKYEYECDQLVHTIMRKLNAAFITPIDREDIDRIAHEMDDIIDGIEAAAHRFRMYNVTEVRKEARVLAHLITDCAVQIQSLMHELKKMNKSKSLNQVAIEINRLENEGDRIYRDAIMELFLREKDPVEILKWKDMFELFESAIDACEDVANIVEGVVMKHA